MKPFRQLKKYGAAIVAGVSSVSAFAAGPDMTALTGAIDYSTVIAAVLGVFALAVGLSLAFKGGEKINSAVKRS